MSKTENSLSMWQPIETAPKDLDGDQRILLASFAPGADIARYVVQAQWGVAMPGYTHCASFSGWFVDPPIIADPSRWKGGRCEHGILYEGDNYAPTHWMPLPKP